MKRIFSNVMLLAAAATAFFSCQKPEVIVPETSQEVTLTFSSEKPAFDDETKTEWTGETIQWSAGDKISIAYTVNDIWQNASGDATGDAKLYKSDVLDAAAEIAQFNVSTDFKGEGEGIHMFYGVYPAPSSTSFADAPIASLTVPALQTPKANSFDGAADLMTGVSVDAFNSLADAKAENISMKWTRLVSHANITLKALNGVTAGERVSSITLTAQEGANLVGQQKVNLLTNEVANDNAASNVLELNGGNLSIDANGNVEFWACVLPETLTSLTVVVETDKATYTREITGISKTFKQNARNTLSVKMDAATRVEKDIVSWVLVTPVDGLTEGTYALVASTSTQTGALVSSNGSSSAPTFETSFSVEENILHGVTAVMQFDITGSAENWVLSVAGDATKWLYCNAANNGVRVGNNDNKTWTISKHNANADAFAFKHISTNRYLGVYNNSDWRCYTAVDAANFTSATGSSQIYLYKKTSGAVAPDTTPKIVVAETSKSIAAEGGELTFAYTLKNLDGEAVTVTETSDFITAEATDGIVTVTVDANETTDERETTITLSCGDADDVILTVTQKGKVVVDSSLDGKYWIYEPTSKIVMAPIAESAASARPGNGNAEVENEVVSSFEKYAFDFTFDEEKNAYTIQDSYGRYIHSGYYNDIPSAFVYASASLPEGESGYWGISKSEDKYVIVNKDTNYELAYDSSYSNWSLYAAGHGKAYPTLVKADNPLPVELSSIAVSGQTTSFELDADFEFDGTVTAIYNDGSTQTVTPTSVSSPDMSAAGNQTVTVTYTEGTITKTAEYTIKITDPNAGGGSGTASYTLLFGSNYNSKSVSSYTDSWSATNNGFTCTLANWNNNNNGWSYVKAGRKNNASVATITTNDDVPEALTTVTMTVDAVTASKINSLKLYVSTADDFSTKDTYTATVATGNVVFNITNPVENAYYKIEVDCASGSSNGLITVSKIVYEN